MVLGRRARFASLLVAALSAACGSREPPAVEIPAQPAPPVRPPSTAAVPDAGVPAPVALALEPPFEPPPAPPKQPFDPKRKVQSAFPFAGANASELWVMVEGTQSVVLDRKSGCITEAFDIPSALERLTGSRDAATTDAELQKPEVLAALRAVVGFARRFEARQFPYLLDLTFSPDGRYVYFVSDERLFRSADGARSFARVDDFLSDRPDVSPDGKHLVYERCIHDHCTSCRKNWAPGCAADREWVTVPTSGARAPKHVSHQTSRLLDFDPRGRARFSVLDGTDIVCLETWDLATPRLDTRSCIPVPAKATGSWPSRYWEAASPSGTYGFVHWEEGRPNRVGAVALTYVNTLVDLTTGKPVKELTDVRGDVDDDGNLVVQSAAEGGGDHTWFHPRTGAKKLLGHHAWLGWRQADKEVFLAPYRPSTLGARKCDLVKVAKVP